MGFGLVTPLPPEFGQSLDEIGLRGGLLSAAILRDRARRSFGPSAGRGFVKSREASSSGNFWTSTAGGAARFAIPMAALSRSDIANRSFLGGD